MEDVLRFIKLGDEEIELSDSRDVTIVVGLSGTGKSTTVQFFANETNPLQSTCDRSERCNVTDLNGDIGNSIVSKTLLPNLVVDNTTDDSITVFYDMPGFDDNRNASVEIANSFFIKKVIEHSTRLRIVVLTKESHMSINEKKNFPDLMMNLAKLIKNPRKFNGGITLLVNMADFGRSDSGLLYGYGQFLHSFYNDIDEVITPEYQDAVRLIVEGLMTLDDEEYPINVSMMRVPISNGTLNDMPVFIKDRIYMKNIIYNQTSLIEKSDDDFGYGLSEKAERFLVEARVAFVELVKEEFDSLADEVTRDLKSKCLQLFNGSGDQGTLEGLLINLKVASYDYLNISSPPTTYMTEILGTVATFAPDLVEETHSKLIATVTFLDYVHITVPGTSFQQHQWIQKVVLIHQNLLEYIRLELVPLIETNVRNVISDFASAAKPVLEELLNQTLPYQNFQSFNTSINVLKSTTYPSCSNGGQTTACLTAIKSSFSQIAPDHSSIHVETVQTIINFIAFCLNAAQAQISFFIDVSYLERLYPNLQTDAMLKLPIATRNITNELKSFSDSVVINFISTFQTLSQSNDGVNIPSFNASLMAVKSANYSGCAGAQPMNCSAIIKSKIIKIHATLASNTAIRVNHTAWFIAFCKSQLEVDGQVNPMDWTTDLQSLEQSLVNNLRNGQTPNSIFNKIYGLLGGITGNLKLEMLDYLNSIVDESERIEKQNYFTSKATQVVEDIRNIQNVEVNLTGAIRGILPLYDEYLDSDGPYTLDTTVVGLLEILDSFGWKEKSWVSPFLQSIKEPMQDEFLFYRYLSAVSIDLTKRVVQVDQNGFHEWWQSAGGNVVGFYDKTVPLSGSMTSPFIMTRPDFIKLTQSTAQSAILRSILQFALQAKPCPSIVSGKMVFKNNFVTIGEVKNCILQQSRVSTVAIITTHTLYFDQDFRGADFNPTNNIQLFILSTNWDATSQININLSGLNGIDGVGTGDSGTPGNMGGNYQAMFSKKNGGGSYTFETNGGNGGHGVTGATGIRGRIGSVKPFDSSPTANDCAAWSGGKVQVRVYPNTCNTCQTDDSDECTCKAGNNGVDITIDGTTGSSGSTGGDGGNSGLYIYICYHSLIIIIIYNVTQGVGELLVQELQ